MQCPLLFRFRAIDKLPEPKTVAQVRGTLVHACLEDMHSWVRAERTYPAVVKRLRPNWADMCDRDSSLVGVVPPAEVYEFFVACRSLLKGYFFMENPQGFDAVACEKFVDAVLPNGVPVRGFIDRVDVAPTGEVRVVDYKTGKKPIPRYQGPALFQMRFYALVWWRTQGVIPHQLRLMYLRAAESLYLAPSREELEFFERDVADLWGKIMRDVAAGLFRSKTSKLCGWCPHQGLCPAFGGTPPPFPGVE